MKKNISHYIISFILPIAIFCFAMYSLGVYPFGNISIRISDALIQYPAFFEGLKHFNLFTFNIGLGANFYPILTTYLNSPLNILYFLFKKENFDLFFVILILIKIGLSSLTMNILLNYKKEKKRCSWIFSTIYALSGFTVTYYWNYQFLDATYMLPLIMIGIDKIVNDNKNVMYYITLTSMIIIHYYTAYMICLFSVIYFFFLLYNSKLNKKEKKQRTIKFFITSLFCGLTSAYILIPTIFSLFQGRYAYINNSNFSGLNWNGLISLYNVTIGSNYNVEEFHHGCIFTYISLFIIIILFLNLLNNKMEIKEKKSLIVIIIIYILSLTVNLIYLIWHLLQEPIGLPGRFIFVFDAFWILMGYKLYCKKTFKIKLKIKLLIFIILLIFFGGLFIFKNIIYNINIFSISNYKYDEIYFWLLILSLAFIIFYLFTYHNYKFKLITYFVVILELTINTIVSINVNFQTTYYKYEYVDEIEQKIKAKDNLINNLRKNNNFMRINDSGAYNDGLFYNYYSVNAYSSIYNKNLNNFLKNYSDSNNLGSLFEYNNNFLMDAVLGVKYSINNLPSTKPIVNNYIINSLGFLTSKENKQELENSKRAEEILKILSNNKYNVEIKKVKPIINLENVYDNGKNFYEIIDNEKEGIITFNYEAKEDIIFNIDIKYLYNFMLLEFDNNGIVNNISKVENMYKFYINNQEVYNVNELKKGDILKIEIHIDKNNNSVYKENMELEYVNKEEFSNLIDYINQNIITDININFRGFKGKISSKNENLLILTIPYDNEIEIKVDGTKTNYDKCLNGIICLNITNGEHDIEMIYHVKGLAIGIIISLISLLIYIILIRKM